MKQRTFVSMTAIKLTKCGLLVIGALLTAGESEATQLIVNGGFEIPVGYYVATTNLPGWYVSDIVDVISHSAGGWPAYEGDQSLHLAGCVTAGAYIEQSFPTVPGQLYRLSFCYANNIAFPSASGWVRVYGSTTLVEEFLAHSGSTQSAMNYTRFETNFVANSSLTTLRFTQPTTGCDGLALDAVEVNDSTPYLVPVTATLPLPRGANTNLSAVVYPSNPCTLQWWLNGTPIAGATGTNLLITNFSVKAAGVYFVTASCQHGPVTATTLLRLTNSPLVLVDGVDVGGGTVDRFGPSQITMSSSYGPNADIYYTLDGSTPDFTRKHYGGSFSLTRSATLRAIAYNQAYTDWAEAAPIGLQFFKATTAGGGSVSLAPASPGGANGYVTNTLVTATATSSNGWSFLQWLGEASGTNPVVTTAMTPDKAMQAVFGTPISTNVLGSGSIVLSLQAPLYPFGTVVRLAAVPQPGNYFFAWHGSVTGTNNPATLIINQPTQLVTAAFASLPASRYSLAVVSGGNGSVTANPYAPFYTNTQTVLLSAAPEVGQAFLGWSGDATGTNNPFAVTMDQSKSITASFTRSSTLSTPADLAAFTPTGFRVFVTGEFGAAYQVLGTTNLTDWLLMGAITNFFGTFQFTDATATNLPARFYRALSVVR
jgi:hypothetical protein